MRPDVRENMRTLMIAAGVLLAAGNAAADMPRGTYEIIEPTWEPSAEVSSRLVYLKRCPPAGCAVHFASQNDSRTGASTIVPSGTSLVGPFTQPDAVWNDLMACARRVFAPFNIGVTDVDPGNVPHFLNIIGGRPQDIGKSANVGGVAPFSCREIPNAISFTFDVYGPDALTLCWTAAQEVAHAFGLDHQFLVQDPMTYLGGSLPKMFQDVDSACGEFSQRACECGRTTQNSYRWILGMFGPGEPTPPEVAILSPTQGKKVQPGFKVRVTANDDVAIDRVELHVNGQLATMTKLKVAGVYELVAPQLPQGTLELEARAFDVQETPASDTITIQLGPPCTQSGGCTGTDVCVEGLCVPGPGQPGGLGAICQHDTECLSRVCADGGEPLKHCVEPCNLNNPNTCPNDFTCAPAGDIGFCWPTPGGGCCDTGGSPHGALLLGLGVFALAGRPRRRGRARGR
jgi:hypothetical protein